MPKSCCAYGCTSHNMMAGEKISFHIFPKDPDRRAKWISAVKRVEWTPTNTTVICGKHFCQGKPHKDSTHPDYVPSVFSYKETSKHQCDSKLHWDESANGRHQVFQDLAPVCSATSKDMMEQSRPSSSTEVDSHNTRYDLDEAHRNEALQKRFQDAGCQTDLTMEKLTQLENAVTGITTEIYTLRTEIVDTDVLQIFQDSEKTRFYTGLPDFSVLTQIYKLCEPHITTSTLRVLTKFEQFIMVLMRLRLNLQIQDLASQFKVSTAAVSQIWVDMINILHEQLKSQIEWPERDVLLSAVPTSFRAAFGDNVAVILDYFEVFIKKPRHLHRTRTMSNNHLHNSVKFVIGISPHRKVTYISRAWGGIASNRQITEECGLLQNLLPGDVVLANRNLDPEGGDGLYCGVLKVPTHTNEKRRLRAYDWEVTPEVVTHVELVTGIVWRKYHILQRPIMSVEHMYVKSNESLALVDKIAVVCGALSNLSLASAV